MRHLGCESKTRSRVRIIWLVPENDDIAIKNKQPLMKSVTGTYNSLSVQCCSATSPYLSGTPHLFRNQISFILLVESK